MKATLVKALIGMRVPAALGMLLLSTASIAQNIGDWTLNNVLTGTGTASNSVSSISAGPAVTSTAFQGGTEWYGQNGFPTGSTLSSTAYIQFTLTPNSGFEINITSIILRIRRSNTGTPQGSGPTLWSVRSSSDGYATDLATGSMNHNYSNYTVPLTGFNQLTGAATFRLYGYGVTVSSGGTSRLVLDNVSVQGVLWILPLQLAAPEAVAKENGNISVSWKADDISAGTRFHLQRSTDGNSFETIYAITEENDKNSNRYTFTDNSISRGIQKVYYRVEALATNGSTELSRTIGISRKIAAKLYIGKIVVHGSVVQAVLQAPAKGNYTLALYSSAGILLYKQVAALEAGSQSTTLPASKLSRGMYVLSVYSNNGSVSRPFLFPIP